MPDQTATGSVSPTTPAGSVSPTGQPVVVPQTAVQAPQATDERIVGELKAKVEAAEKEQARLGRLLTEQQARTGDATAQAVAAKAEAEKLAKERVVLAASATERDALVAKLHKQTLENALAAKVIHPELVASGLRPDAAWYDASHALTKEGLAAIDAFVAALSPQMLRIPTGGSVPPPLAPGVPSADMASIVAKYDPMALVYGMINNQSKAGGK
jgi:hypothetical protein